MSLRAEDPANIGEYVLRGRLGQGGQGAVYLGAGPGGELVAIKWLHPHLTDDTVAAERFAREAAVALRVAPFCTAKLIATGVQSGRPYLVSEYVDGPSLHHVVREQGPRTGASLHRLAIGTATALAAIHQAGVVHRDFSPSNVLLASDGPRVIDFGIARALEGTSTITSTPMGTPAYMAPEQIMGAGVGPATDMFAWASTIVFAASGNAPFVAPSVPAVINRVLNTEADLSVLDGDLRELVAACLSKNPGVRPTAEQVLMRLLRTPVQPSSQPFQRPLSQPQTSWPSPAGPSTPPTHPQHHTGQAQGASLGQSPAGGSSGGARRGWVIAAVAALVAVSLTALAVVLTLRGGTDTATTASPSHTAPTARTPSASPSRTEKPVKTVLPDARATLYERPSDPVVLTAYSFEKDKWVDHARASLTGSFKAYPNHMDARLSPDGRYLATRTKTYTAAQRDSIQLTDHETGDVTVVETAKEPLQSVVEVWSRDSTKLLLNVGRNISGKWHTSGYAVITVGRKDARLVTLKGLPRDTDFGFDPAGTGIVALSSSASRQTMRFYDLDGRQRRTLANVGGGYAKDLFSPSGRLFATDCPGMSSSDHCVFDATSGGEQARFASSCDYQEGWYDEKHLLCWGEDSKQFVVVDFEGNVVRVLADVPTGVGDHLTFYWAHRTP
ncbi:serine/threonine protein kinase [Nonomuraea sp. NPDC050556]|uniref:serine/threonine protein kinase n=1 Tax=Nonomuraea sp. NPDC050556 TaxID=3364369 RepID=UPI0037A3EDB4